MRASTDSSSLVFMDSGSTSRPADPSDSISAECLIDVSLPEELITEILVRLPVKSLLRFKCVSKPWLSLISNPQFITSHLSKSTSNEAAELLFATKDGMKKFSLYSVLHEVDPSTHVSAIEFPAEIPQAIVGIINGLVCLNLNGTDLCLWNPALNKIMHLNFHPEPPSGRVNYSFGYEESNDEYKVVCVHTVARNDGVLTVFYGEDAEVFIYSLNAGSCRRIDELKGFYMVESGVFANGKIYWYDYLGVWPRNRKNFVSIDMLTEKLLEIQPPEYDDDGKFESKMGVSGGRPFVLCDYYEGRKVDLWVLDKHGVEESWCKLVSIPYSDVNRKTFCFDYRVLWIARNGEIVFGDEFGLLVYNWKKKESRKIKLDVGIPSRTRIAAYVESLVWPDYA